MGNQTGPTPHPDPGLRVSVVRSAREGLSLVCHALQEKRTVEAACIGYEVHPSLKRAFSVHGSVWKMINVRICFNLGLKLKGDLGADR
jgi:hypothetical protein